MKDNVKNKCMPASPETMVEGLETQNGYSCLSLKVLGHSTYKLLSNHLDIPADIVTENGLTPDVFGLAELAGFDSSYVRRLASKPDKTIALLDAWARKPDGTIGKLLTSLDTLGRLDCKSDITPSIARDIKNWLQSDAKEPNQPEAVDILREHPPRLKIPPPSHSNQQHQEFVSSPVSPARSSGSDVTDHMDGPLTLDDLEGNQTSYVACICCSDDDIEIAHTIIGAYRGVTDTVQFFLPQEQLLGGRYEYESLAEVIEDRCDGRLLVIMSRTYGSSPACIFSTQFVKSLDPDAKRRKIIPIIKDEDATYPRVLRGINAIKLQRLKFSLPFWKLLSASLEIKSIPKHSQTDSSLLSPSRASVPSSSYTSSSSSPSLSSTISYPSSFSSKSAPSRTFSVESFESIIDNENVSRVHGLQHQTSTISSCSSPSSPDHCQNSLPVPALANGSSSGHPFRQNETGTHFQQSKITQGTSGVIRSSESSCSSCNPGTVKKSSKKIVTKLMKRFGLRSKSSKSLMEDPLRSCVAPQTLRSNSEPAETLQRAFKSCDDILNDRRKDKTTRLHFVQNIVTSLKTNLSGSRELTKCGQSLEDECKSESMASMPSPVSSSGDLQTSPGGELPLNIRMNTFNIIQREYSVDGNTESAIMRSSGYSDSNTESAILRGAGSTESIDDNTAEFTLC